MEDIESTRLAEVTGEGVTFVISASLYFNVNSEPASLPLPLKVILNSIGVPAITFMSGI